MSFFFKNYEYLDILLYDKGKCSMTNTEIIQAKMTALLKEYLASPMTFRARCPYCDRLTAKRSGASSKCTHCNLWFFPAIMNKQTLKICGCIESTQEYTYEIEEHCARTNSGDIEKSYTITTILCDYTKIDRYVSPDILIIFQ